MKWFLTQLVTTALVIAGIAWLFPQSVSLIILSIIINLAVILFAAARIQMEKDGEWDQGAIGLAFLMIIADVVILIALTLFVAYL